MRRRQVMTGLVAVGFGAAIAHPPQPRLAQKTSAHLPIQPPQFDAGDRFKRLRFRI